MQPIEFILNASAGRPGQDDADSALKARLAERNIEARIHLTRDGDELVEFARRAASSEAAIVVVGGGDGTVSAVAAELAGSEKKLGVLPLGTLNHFAKDLHIPDDLGEAVDIIATGNTSDIDVGEVNGSLFINNSSLGLYPEMVRGREMRQRIGYGKWHSLARSAFAVFRRYPLVAVRLKADGKEISTRTPFVFIGNNEYEIESFSIGARKRIDGGQLSVYMTRRSGRLALIRIALKAVFGGLSQEKDFLSVLTDEILIETRRPQIRVAMDGEVMTMKTPLRYRIRPGTLRVIVPESPENGKADQ